MSLQSIVVAFLLIILVASISGIVILYGENSVLRMQIYTKDLEDLSRSLKLVSDALDAVTYGLNYLDKSSDPNETYTYITYNIRVIGNYLQFAATPNTPENDPYHRCFLETNFLVDELSTLSTTLYNKILREKAKNDNTTITLLKQRVDLIGELSIRLKSISNMYHDMTSRINVNPIALLREIQEARKLVNQLSSIIQKP